MFIGQSGMKELVEASKNYADTMNFTEEQKDAFEEFVKQLMHWTINTIANAKRVI